MCACVSVYMCNRIAIPLDLSIFKKIFTSCTGGDNESTEGPSLLLGKAEKQDIDYKM